MGKSLSGVMTTAERDGSLRAFSRSEEFSVAMASDNQDSEALASQRPPDSQWAEKEVVLIKQDLDELHGQDAQRAKDDCHGNANVGGVKRDPLQAYHDPTAVAMRKDFPYELLLPTEPSK